MQKITILFLSLLFLVLGRLQAQQVTITPSDSVISEATVNNNLAAIDEHIYLHNTQSDSIQISWRVVADSSTGWSLSFCDNNNCYGLPDTSTMVSLKFASGDSLDMHATIAPNLIGGSGWLKISAQIANDTFPALILTYSADFTVVSGVQDEDGKPNGIHVFPNPINDAITVEGLVSSDEVTVQVLDLLGRLVSSKAVMAGENTTRVKIEYLAPGCYLLKIVDAKNEQVVLRKVTKL